MSRTTPAAPTSATRVRRIALGAAAMGLALAGCAQAAVSPASDRALDGSRADAVVVSRDGSTGRGTPPDSQTPEPSAAGAKIKAQKPERAKRTGPRPSPTTTKSAPRTPKPTPSTRPTKKPKPSPTRTTTPRPTPSPTATKSPRPKPSPTPTSTKSPKPKPSPTPTPTSSPKPKPPAGTRLAALHPFSSSSPANTAIGSKAKYGSASDSRMKGLTSAVPTINSTNWSIAVAYAKSSDPVATLKDTKAGKSYKIHIPKNAKVTGGTDRHLSVIQPDGRTAYEIYAATKISSTEWTSTRVVKTDLFSDGLRDGARASSVSHLIGLIRTHEVAAKKIPHVLALGLPNESLKSGFVWPARAQDTSNNKYSGTVPMGSLFAIPADVDLSKLDLTPEGLALARALQDYGAYVLIRSGTAALYAEPDADSAALGRMKSDYQKKLFELLRPVTNNAESTPGGGGTPRQPVLPAPQAP